MTYTDLFMPVSIEYQRGVSKMEQRFIQLYSKTFRQFYDLHESGDRFEKYYGLPGEMSTFMENFISITFE